MVDYLTQIRQMMAESKFSEALSFTEVQLSILESTSRLELLPLYLELLEIHKRTPHPILLIEAAESVVDRNIEQAEKWMHRLSPVDLKLHFRRTTLIKMKIAEAKGNLLELYRYITELNLHLYEAKVPHRLDVVFKLQQKYFKHDFHLRLNDLAVHLMLSELGLAEETTKELILSCCEKSSPRGTTEKLNAIREVIQSFTERSYLEIYSNLCLLSVGGIGGTADYKKLAEMVIYFDDFKFQVLLFNLLVEFGFSDCIESYSSEIKNNVDYDFVYLDKYFNHLKQYFHAPRESKEKHSEVQVSQDDLILNGPTEVADESPAESLEASAEELLIMKTLKFHDYSLGELLELAVSFLQSDFIQAANEATQLCMDKAQNDSDYLKACYLKLICLMKHKDYRAALDLSFVAIEKAVNENDLLSFLYLQSEAYLQLGDKAKARKILNNISKVDSNYRLVSERLKRLDEI